MVRTWGTGEPILLVHGIPGSSLVWEQVGRRLAEAGFQAIAPDLVGFGGDADEPPAADEVWADAQAAELARALDELGIERAALVGHDFGGPVALALTARRPELATSLVLCATNTFPDVPIPMPIRAVTWPVVGDLAARLLFSTPALRMMVGRGFAEQTPELDDAVWFGDDRQRAAIRTIFTTALRDLRERYTPVESNLRAVSCPALVVWAGRDDFFDLAQGRRTADALPDGRLAVYDDCGHYVPVERPERLAADIQAFVRESDARAA